jgi:hypothetical protein
LADGMGAGRVASVMLGVDLGQPNHFHDIPDIPARFHKRFQLEVPDDNHGDPDWTVTDAIRDMGVWEPWETMFLSSAFAAAASDTLFVDLGAHVGWFCALASAWGLNWHAVEFNRNMVRYLRRMAKRTGLGYVDNCWVDQYWALAGQPRPMIVKMDLEGNERFAVAGMFRWFKTRQVTHCLMEVSPVFNDSYPHLVWSLIDAGYEAWVMPEKTLDGESIDGPFKEMIESRCRSMHTWSFDVLKTWLDKQHQINVMFCLSEAKWG